MTLGHNQNLRGKSKAKSLMVQFHYGNCVVSFVRCSPTLLRMLCDGVYVVQQPVQPTDEVQGHL